MAIRASGPYPPVKVQEKNPVYAEMMLGNIGGSNSEMSAVAHYRYAHVCVENERLAELVHQISIVEMQHLDDFAHLAKLLGADPRMWQSCGCKKVYWSPAYVDYEFCSACELVQKFIDEEKSAIRKYTAQVNCISDLHVVAVLQRIIEDEEEHVKTWEAELAKLR